uniref:Transposon protein, CACTA, En/Spm sub-class n=1 Tax=Solanum tuberosum TaxID=4113 RepID=M1DX22_SOLTU
MRFKMKPLKTENEVDSSMKSTIRYAFVAPGAIGKGRGRGLKSLAERRNFPTKCFVSQSSDLVNQYIQEIETRKGGGQGLTNSTLFTSQGMATIPKNSIDLEKENKQTNPSAHASTNLGKGGGQGLTNSTLFTSQGMATKPKNSIDLEKENKQTNPSAHASTNLGKGRGQGLKSSTFSTSQGMGMKHNNYMTSDSEVGCINKSALYANQHIKTPSKSTRANSTMSSSQEMQRMEKMILEKEDMQTNSFPPSIDQVIENSQITEKGLSNPTKHKFEAVDMNDHRDHIMGWMNELWNKWRGYLHAKYVKDNPIQQSLKNIPRGVDKKEWEWLVKEHFTSESFQAQLKEIVQEDPSLARIEIVEKCCGPQTRSHVFGFGGGVKAKDLKGGTSSKAEILSALRSTRDDNKFLNEENKSLIEENKSLNDRLSTLEDTMKEIMKMKELFAAQHSDAPPTISPFSTE